MTAADIPGSEAPALRHWLAALECQDVALRFMALFDARDWAGVEALAAPEIEWQRPDRIIHGLAELRQVLAATPAENRVRHVITNLRAHAVGEGRMVVESYFTVYRATGPGLQPETAAPLDGPVSMGRYHDELVQAGGTWKLLRKQTNSDFRRSPA